MIDTATETDEKNDAALAALNKQLCDPTEFLMNYATPERTELLTCAYNTLIGLGYDILTDEVLKIIRESDNMGPEIVIGGFNDLILHVQKDAVAKHGITMRVDTPIQIYDAVLCAMVQIADYEDVEQLLTSFEIGIMSDPTDVFVDLLEEVLGDDIADEVALYIMGLSTAFLPSMRQYLVTILEEREDNDLDATTTISEDVVDKLKKQAAVAEGLPNVQMLSLLSGVMPPKLEYQYYITELAYRHRNEQDMNVIATDMFMACTVCLEAPGDPLKFISGFLIDFTDDVNQQVLIMNRVRYILGELAIEPK